MSGPKRVAIIGAGGFAREVLDIVEAHQGAFTMEGFLVSAGHGVPGTLVNDRPVLGDLSWLLKGTNREVEVICAVGAPQVRRRLVMEAMALGARFFTAVHPGAHLTRWIEMGEGCVIGAGCILTNRIRIGEHVHVNLACTIGHDASVGGFVTLSPGVHVSGNVEIGEGAAIGTGTSIIEHRLVGAWSVVGAGSAVTADIPPNSTAVGVPARPIKTRPEGWHLL